MDISARLHHHGTTRSLAVATGGKAQPLVIAARPGGGGSAVNGGELLMAALATCYCNDLYREAERLGIAIRGCEVVASTRFAGPGSRAEAVLYAARVESEAPPEQVEALLAATDRLAEVHNTLRAGCGVQRVDWGHCPGGAGAPGGLRE